MLIRILKSEGPLFHPKYLSARKLKTFHLSPRIHFELYQLGLFNITKIRLKGIFPLTSINIFGFVAPAYNGFGSLMLD
jgi:hypothetical protein